jgi:hypothetical protein
LPCLVERRKEEEEEEEEEEEAISAGMGVVSVASVAALSVVLCSFDHFSHSGPLLYVRLPFGRYFACSLSVFRLFTAEVYCADKSFCCSSVREFHRFNAFCCSSVSVALRWSGCGGPLATDTGCVAGVGLGRRFGAVDDVGFLFRTTPDSRVDRSFNIASDRDILTVIFLREQGVVHFSITLLVKYLI